MAPTPSRQDAQRREPGVQGQNRLASDTTPETPTTAAGAVASAASAAAAVEIQGTPGPRSFVTVHDCAAEVPMTFYGTMRRQLNSVMRAAETLKENVPLPLRRKIQACERKVCSLLDECEKSKKEADRLEQLIKEEKRKRDPPTGAL